MVDKDNTMQLIHFYNRNVDKSKKQQISIEMMFSPMWHDEEALAELVDITYPAMISGRSLIDKPKGLCFYSTDIIFDSLPTIAIYQKHVRKGRYRGMKYSKIK